METLTLKGFCVNVGVFFWMAMRQLIQQIPPNSVIPAQRSALLSHRIGGGYLKANRDLAQLFFQPTRIRRILLNPISPVTSPGIGRWDSDQTRDSPRYSQEWSIYMSDKLNLIDTIAKDDKFSTFTRLMRTSNTNDHFQRRRTVSPSSCRQTTRSRR